jgi:hypothetical protein
MLSLGPNRPLASATRSLASVMVFAAVMDVAAAGPPSPRPEPVIGVPTAVRIDTAMVVTPAEKAALTLPWCADSGYELERWKVDGPFAWSYNPGDAPAAVAGSAARGIRAATDALVAGRNDCGWTRPFRVRTRYLGRTDAALGVSASGRCTGDDGRSVTGWKRLTGEALAITCTYYYPGTGVVASSDVAINTRYRWFVDRPARCTDAYDLVGVLTHERGHSFGLSHARPGVGPGQTMDTSIAACSVTQRTLAGGDYAGMRRIYGTA